MLARARDLADSGEVGLKQEAKDRVWCCVIVVVCLVDLSYAPPPIIQASHS